MEEYKMAVKVTCPVCKKRVIDKLSPSSGTIRIKCPHCKNEVSINLALRKLMKTA